VPTIYSAKQLISHKKVKVNNYSNSSFSRLLKKGDVITFDFSTQVSIQKHVLTHLANSEYFLNNSNQIEVNFKSLRIVVLANKINLFSQIPQYHFKLQWNNIL
jgi:ribosomal protein S4